MNIGIFAQKKERQIDGINRVTKELLPELMKYDVNNSYSFIGNSSWLSINCSYVDCLVNTRGINNFNGIAIGGKYNIIHSHYRPFHISSKIECTKILTIHDLLVLVCPECKSGPKAYFDGPIRKCAEEVDLIFADSHNTKKDIVDIYNINPDKIKVVYNGLFDKKQIIPKELRISQTIIKNRYIVAVSTMREYKNITGLVKAFCIYKKKCPQSDIQLVLVGKNDKTSLIGKEVQSYINERNDILFTGYISDAELSWLYKYSLCSAMLSFYEGFGLPVLESLSFGKTVICSNTSSLPEVGGNAVCYCNPRDIESIVNAMEQVIENDTYRNDLERKTMEQMKKFSFEKMAKETAQIYNSCR